MCPECGRETEHEGGWPLPSRPTWRLLGWGRWVAVLAPGLAAAMTVVTGWYVDRINSLAMLSVATHGLLFVVNVWVSSLGWAASGLPHSLVKFPDRVRIIVRMALASAALAFAVSVALARVLLH